MTMPAEVPPALDRDLAAVYAEMHAADAHLPDPPVVGLDEAQASRDRYYAFVAAAEPKLAMDATIDATATEPFNNVALRVYFPTGERPAPVIVWLHGGGWWTGSVAAYDHMARKLAADAGCAVASVDYRLWPAHKYPVAMDDTMAAIGWVLERGPEFGLDASRVAFAGDSAGATTALAAAVELRGDPAVKALGLIYGVYTTDTQTHSWQTIGDGTYGLTGTQMQWIWDGYLAGRLRPGGPADCPAERRPWRSAAGLDDDRHARPAARRQYCAHRATRGGGCGGDVRAGSRRHPRRMDAASALSARPRLHYRRRGGARYAAARPERTTVARTPRADFRRRRRSSSSGSCRRSAATVRRSLRASSTSPGQT